MNNALPDLSTPLWLRAVSQHAQELKPDDADVVDLLEHIFMPAVRVSSYRDTLLRQSGDSLRTAALSVYAQVIAIHRQSTWETPWKLAGLPNSFACPETANAAVVSVLEKLLIRRIKLFIGEQMNELSMGKKLQQAMKKQGEKQHWIIDSPPRPRHSYFWPTYGEKWDLRPQSLSLDPTRYSFPKPKATGGKGDEKQSTSHLKTDHPLVRNSLPSPKIVASIMDHAFDDVLQKLHFCHGEALLKAGYPSSLFKSFNAEGDAESEKGAALTAEEEMTTATTWEPADEAEVIQLANRIKEAVMELDKGLPLTDEKARHGFIFIRFYLWNKSHKYTLQQFEADSGIPKSTANERAERIHKHLNATCVPQATGAPFQTRLNAIKTLLNEFIAYKPEIAQEPPFYTE